MFDVFGRRRRLEPGQRFVSATNIDSGTEMLSPRSRYTRCMISPSLSDGARVPVLIAQIKSSHDESSHLLQYLPGMVVNGRVFFC